MRRLTRLILIALVAYVTSRVLGARGKQAEERAEEHREKAA